MPFADLAKKVYGSEASLELVVQQVCCLPLNLQNSAVTVLKPVLLESAMSDLAAVLKTVAAVDPMKDQLFEYSGLLVQ